MSTMFQMLSLVTLIVGFSAQAKLASVKICVPRFHEEFLTVAMLEAQDQGFFKKQDLNVEFVTEMGSNSPNGKQSRLPVDLKTAVVNDKGVARRVGSKDGGCQFGSSVIESYMFDTDTAVRDTTQPLFVSMYGEKYDTHLVTAANSPIKSIKDLKGKRIRIGQLPTHIAIRKILAEEGLDIKDVELDLKTQSVDVLAKLESGYFAAAITYVPTMPYMMASGKVRVLKSNIVKSYVQTAVPHSLAVVNREFAAQNPEVVKRFTLALQDAQNFLARNPSEAIYVFQRHAGQLGATSSKWNVDKVIAEKAGSFVGDVTLVNLYEPTNPMTRDQAVQAVNDYAALVSKSGYEPKQTNFSAWMTVAPTAQKVGLR